MAITFIVMQHAKTSTQTKHKSNNIPFGIFLDDIIGAPYSKLIGVCLKKSDSADVISDHLHHFKIMIFGLDHI